MNEDKTIKTQPEVSAAASNASADDAAANDLPRTVADDPSPPPSGARPASAATPTPATHEMVSSDDQEVSELLATQIMAPPPQPGALGTVDHYKIIRRLGEGGMGVVLLAEDTRNGQRVAMKTIKPDFADNQRLKHDFLREAQHMKRLEHEHILPVRDIVQREAGHYYTMPFVEGGSTADLVKDGVRPDRAATRRILNIALQVSDAMRYAWEHGSVVHRDIKPENVLLDRDAKGNDHAYVADFGLVRSFDHNDTLVSDDDRPRKRVGTLIYMAPEVLVQGHPGDSRADIYSFGAMLYYLLSGERPFDGKTTQEIIRKVEKTGPLDLRQVNPALDEHVVRFVERCMGRDLDERYSSWSKVSDDLERVLAGKAIGGPVAASAASGGRKGGVLAAALAAVLLGVGGVGAWLAFGPGLDGGGQHAGGQQVAVGDGEADDKVNSKDDGKDGKGDAADKTDGKATHGSDVKDGDAATTHAVAIATTDKKDELPIKGDDTKDAAGKGADDTQPDVKGADIKGTDVKDVDSDGSKPDGSDQGGEGDQDEVKGKTIGPVVPVNVDGGDDGKADGKDKTTDVQGTSTDGKGGDAKTEGGKATDGQTKSDADVPDVKVTKPVVDAKLAGALREAISNGNASAVKATIDALRQHNRIADASDPYLLREAVKSGRLPMVQLILGYKVDVKAAGPDGMTALHEAAVAGHAEIAQALISADASAVHARERISKRTPLHLAAGTSSKAMIALLLKCGARLSDVDSGERTALHIAAAGNFKAVDALLANATNKAIEEAIDVRDHNGQTALHYAAKANDLNSVELLLKHGADTTIRDNTSKHHYADELTTDARVRGTIKKVRVAKYREQFGN